MAEINHSAWVDAKDYLYQCESLSDPKALNALDTIWKAADEAGSVTVEIRTVSRANRRGDTRTNFASDIRYARAMYTVAEWAMPLLVARVRELEAQAASLPTPARAEGVGEVVKLYLFDQWGDCTGFVRSDKGSVERTCEDELPETLFDVSDHGVFCVWDGEILDTRTLTEAECDEKGIPFVEAQKCDEWWHGSMRPATDAEILAVFSPALTAARTTEGATDA